MTSIQPRHDSQMWSHSFMQKLDLDHPIDEPQIEFGQAAISETNPHRFEMELLSGVIAFRPTDGVIAGVKYVAETEFWALRHCPNAPIFPPVLMIEVASQLCAFYWKKTHPADRRTFALGEIKAARFHGAPAIGDRLVVVAKAVDLKHRKAEFDTAGFVAGRRLFDATIVGMALRPPKN